MTYVYRISDAEGVWGEVQVGAESEATAAVKVKLHLKEELTPEGSLSGNYEMQLIEVR